MSSRRWPGLVTESCLRLPQTTAALRRRCTRGLTLLWRRRQQQLQFSSTSSRDDKQVAVIGGGITGLATAFHLAQQRTTQVTLYEKSRQLGGWMQSETVDTGDGKVVFEYGPRTLRYQMPDVMPVVELLAQLDLLKSTLRTNSGTAAAVNRYIYFPDHIIQVPAPQPGSSTLSFIRRILSQWNEPAYKGLLSGFLGEPFRELRDPKMRDESIADFTTRRFGKPLTDNFVSALFHGIYAGDIDRLSAKATMPYFWSCELGEHGVLMEIMDRTTSGKMSLHRYSKLKAIKDIRRDYSGEFNSRLPLLFAGSNMLSLNDGLHSLVSAMDRHLSELPNVKITREAAISHIQYDRAKQSMIVKLTEGSNMPPVRYDYVVSTTPSRVLADQLRGPGGCTPPTATSRMLAANNYAVSVMVVNLFYSDPDLIPMQGFGYLIPRSVPIEQNPERALGVIFMSQAIVGQDTAKGTKLAVMIGGHWWDGWSRSDLPDEQEGIAMAKSVLARHLGITQEPAIARARLQHNAIPQYTVGHHDRMEELHESLSREYDSRLKVVGAWYTGVGVNDCVTAGRALATAIRDGSHEETGLEDYVNPMKELTAAMV
ncbi:oxygen-dependent protoporphyrinogen oxidase [Microsporum audouinii]